MDENNCPKDAVLAAWAICSPESLERAHSLPSSLGWKELTGPDVYIYLRFTPSAARALAHRLLEASDGRGGPGVVADDARPEGTFDDVPWHHEYGFFVHPRGSSLTFELHDMPDIQQLMVDKAAGDDRLLSPAPQLDTVFNR